MLNVVLDTNVFISAVLISEGPSAKIIEKWENGRFWLIISKSIIEEIRKVFL
jgi:putative PIN family toxin of toxin-antitoxin system